MCVRKRECVYLRISWGDKLGMSNSRGGMRRDIVGDFTVINIFSVVMILFETN